MYDYFRGKLIEKTPTYAVIDCGGVGYVLNISLTTFSQITNPENCLLYAHLAVREDAHVLFGFASKTERETFRLLINVSGVGYLVFISQKTANLLKNQTFNSPQTIINLLISIFI